MTVRELLELLTDHAADGRTMGEQVVVRVGKTLHHLETGYVDGTLILVAGTPIL